MELFAPLSLPKKASQSGLAFFYAAHILILGMGSNPPLLGVVNNVPQGSGPAPQERQLHPTGNYGYEFRHDDNEGERRDVRRLRREAREMTELSQTPKYRGQYVNGYYQTTNPAGPDYLDPLMLPVNRQQPYLAIDGNLYHSDTLMYGPQQYRGVFIDKFREWNNRRYQASDPTRSDYLSLQEFYIGKHLPRDQTWQSDDPTRPMYMPPDTFQYYERLYRDASQARSVQLHNAEQARLARGQMALPWWKRIFGGGGDDDQSSSDKRRPLNPRLVVAAAVVLLVILLIAFVVALLKCKNGGHQKPAQGLWGYDWTASGGRPR
jgi:hypothetical protein